MEVEVVVYPTRHSMSENTKLESYNNLLKFKGTLKRAIDYKSERNNYLDEKHGCVT
jgi:hypothetical protein